MKRVIWLAAVLVASRAGIAADAGATGASEATAATSAEPTPEVALARLKNLGLGLTAAEMAAFEPVIEQAADADPKNAKWQFAKALMLRAQMKSKESREALKLVVAMEPSNADYHFWYGTMIFSTINDAGMLAKMGMADDGKAEFDKAIELDPDHFEARYALAQFYLRAPGVAGGSTKKARQQGEELLKIERGVIWGHIVLAQIAADDEKWDEMTTEYAKALEAAGEASQRAMVYAMHGFALLREKKDFEGALGTAAQFEKEASPMDTTGAFLRGEACREWKRFPDAIAAYQKVLEINADARNTRFSLAQCYEANGDYADAVKQYEEFATRFPKDDRASDAKSKVKKLGKKLGK